MTSPWRVVAVDDEPPALVALARLFEGVTDFQLVATATDPIDATEMIRREAPAVVFLDIQMPGATGFDVMASLGAANPAVVFVTAYAQHAVEAFEADAIDYLLKPVERERFDQTLVRLRRRLRERRGGDLLPKLQALFGVRDLPSGSGTAVRAPLPPQRLALRRQRGTTLIDPLTIDRIEAHDNDLRIFAGRDVFEVRETLTSFEQRLPPGHFVRVQRSALVNRSRVRHIEPWFHGDYRLLLVDGTEIISGRSYRARIREAFGL